MIQIFLRLLAALAVSVVSGYAVAPPASASTSTLGQRLVSTADIPAILQATWQGYKGDFIQYDGRVIDHYRKEVSTSEGESYALLRAVWMNDRPEFDLVWQWTQNNLQVRGDKLFGFLWGHHANQWSVINKDSASDADEDIALALVFAGKTWHSDAYMQAGKAVIKDIWKHEVAGVHGTPYLTAGSWAPSQQAPGVAVNPSYFAPYAYRIFGQVDTSHPWQQVVNSSYGALETCSKQPLGSRRSAGLPPNWCAISRQNGSVVPATGVKGGAAYGYDAFRTMWRTALDFQWNHTKKSSAYLKKSSFLRQQWRRSKTLFSQYRHDGTVLARSEDPTVYGGDIGNFLVSDQKNAQLIANEKLFPVFKQEGKVAYFDQRYNYYEQNWVWFGLALMGSRLPNLYLS